jgi:hypothetical protein
MPLGYKEPPDALANRAATPADGDGGTSPTVPPAAAKDVPEYRQPGAAVPFSGPALIDELMAKVPDSGFTEADVPGERVRRLLQWQTGNPRYVGWLAAYLNRFGEFFGMENRIMRYRIKPWPVTLGFGLPGVALWVLQWWMPEWNAAWGRPLGIYTGLVRFGMMLAGAYCIFAAWPYYIRDGETPAQRTKEFAALDEARRGFHRKIHR